jgi:hypothetical protein
MVLSDRSKPHILMVVARGEAVRNFLYSETLRVLSKNAKVTLLSLVDHGEVIKYVKPFVDNIIPLEKYCEKSAVVFFRDVIHTAHYRWLWSEAVKYYWGRHNHRVRGNLRETLKLYAWRFFGWFFANRPMLVLGTRIEQWLSWHYRPTRDFDHLFRELKPDLVFNCSHIHGPQADLPMRVAIGLGIPTVVFVFSWDNLTSRSRIFPVYDHFLMWNQGMRDHLLELYHPTIQSGQVHITGTPQFDFHFNPDFVWDRERLCAEVGLDPRRRYILYTTGMASDFPEEHRIVVELIRYLKEMDSESRPQLVVRTYIKGTSEEMLGLADKHAEDPDVIFPPILWDKEWIMPLHHDLYVYSNLLRYTALGINPASTVTLELMMFGKPAINLGFEPPETNLPRWTRFSRHVDYEHYRPVASSGGVMVARSIEDLHRMVIRGLTEPEADRQAQDSFIKKMFDNTLDGKSGQRVAETLLSLVYRNYS